MKDQESPIANFNIAEMEKRLELPFTRQEIESILNQEDYNPQQLLELLEKDDFLRTQFSRDAGVNQGYTIREHTLMGSGQLERYFSDKPLPGSVNTNLFRLMYALHDIGKGEAVARGIRTAQHSFTTPILETVLSRLGYSRSEIRTTKTLVDGDPIGSYMQHGDIEKSAEELAHMATDSGLFFSEFWDTVDRFYQVDASSYTVDAGAKEPSPLDNLFVFDREHRHMTYTPEAAEKIERLRSVAKDKAKRMEGAKESIAMFEAIGEHMEDYLPGLEQVRYKDVAHELIETTERATEGLAKATELARKKQDFLKRYARNDPASGESSSLESREHDPVPELDKLMEILASEHPYELIAGFRNLPSLERYLPAFQPYENLFTTKSKVLSKVWNQKEYTKRVEAANKAAKEAASSAVTSIIEGINFDISEKSKIIATHNRGLREAYKNLCEAENDEVLNAAIHTMEDTKVEKSEWAHAFSRFKKITDDFNVVQGKYNNYIDPITYWRPSILGLSDLEREIQSQQGFLENKGASKDVWVVLATSAEELKRQLEAMFFVPRGSPRGGTKECWSLTKEFIAAERQFNQELKAAEQITGFKIESFSWPLTQVTDAWKISSGRLLTHTAPNQIMYDILTSGSLNAVKELRKRKPSLSRTYGNSGEDDKDKEIHEISFFLNGVYANGQGRTELGENKPVDIALVFSENQLLSQGRPFVDDADGSHLYDTAFTGENETSPGLSLDLKQIPFMVVTEKERSQFIEFLKSQSAWAEELTNLPEGDFSAWLDKNVLFVERVGDFKGDENTRRLFESKKGASPKKGFVEWLGNATMKVGNEWALKRFVPLESS